MPKMKVVHFDELYNCLVDDFLIWNRLVFENAVWSYLVLISKLGTCQWAISLSAASQISSHTLPLLTSRSNFIFFISPALISLLGPPASRATPAPDKSPSRNLSPSFRPSLSPSPPLNPSRRRGCLFVDAHRAGRIRTRWRPTRRPGPHLADARCPGRSAPRRRRHTTPTGSGYASSLSPPLSATSPRHRKRLCFLAFADLVCYLTSPPEPCGSTTPTPPPTGSR